MKVNLLLTPVLMSLAILSAPSVKAGTGIPSNCRDSSGTINWECVCEWWCPDNGGSACNCDINPDSESKNSVFQDKSKTKLSRKLNGENVQKRKSDF